MKKKLVVLTGAGISQESGIPTFRDSGGLWEGHNVMDVASPGGWERDPKMVLEFYNQRRKQILKVKPNRGHKIIAELENHFDTTIITQNIDNLHELAGSTKVIHLHGSIFETRPVSDPTRIYHLEGVKLNLGDTDEFGEQLRPNVVWFGETVPRMVEAIDFSIQADIFLVVGTSLVVYPAAGLIEYIKPNIPKFIINPDLSGLVEKANLFMIPEKAGIGMDIVRRRLLTEYNQ
jgi:NAD-dependent deacetylase